MLRIVGSLPCSKVVVGSDLSWQVYNNACWRKPREARDMLMGFCRLSGLLREMFVLLYSWGAEDIPLHDFQPDPLLKL